MSRSESLKRGALRTRRIDVSAIIPVLEKMKGSLDCFAALRSWNANDFSFEMDWQKGIAGMLHRRV